MKRYKSDPVIAIEGRNIYLDMEYMAYDPGTEQVFKTFTENIDDLADAMFYIDETGQFYFIVGKKWDIAGFAEKTGYLIADITAYNSTYLIGWGVHAKANIKCLISGNAFSDTQFRALRDALEFTFLRRRLSLFYPEVQRFQHRFEIDGHPCYALYDYVPNKRNTTTPIDARQAKNLIFKFKDGKHPELAARLLSLAVAGEGRKFIPYPANTVLIPIPASTHDANDSRFRVFCKELSSSLGIADGFDLIALDEEREPNAIKKGMPLTNVIRLTDGDRIAGKDVIIVDDVVTRGEQFGQIATYLKYADARSIKGLFLAKTLKSGE